MYIYIYIYIYIHHLCFSVPCIIMYLVLVFQLTGTSWLPMRWGFPREEVSVFVVSKPSSKVNHVPQPNVGVYIYIPYMDPMGVEWKFIYTFEKNNMDTTKIPQKKLKEKSSERTKTHHFVWLPCWFFRSGPTTSFIRFFGTCFDSTGSIAGNGSVQRPGWSFDGLKPGRFPREWVSESKVLLKIFDWETNKDLHLSLVLQEIFFGTCLNIL